MMCGGFRSICLPGPESTTEVEELDFGVSHGLLDFLEGRNCQQNRKARRPESGGDQSSILALSAVLSLLCPGDVSHGTASGRSMAWVRLTKKTQALKWTSRLANLDPRSFQNKYTFMRD